MICGRNYKYSYPLHRLSILEESLFGHLISVLMYKKWLNQYILTNTLNSYFVPLLAPTILYPFSLSLTLSLNLILPPLYYMVTWFSSRPIHISFSSELQTISNLLLKQRYHDRKKRSWYCSWRCRWLAKKKKKNTEADFFQTHTWLQKCYNHIKRLHCLSY